VMGCYVVGIRIISSSHPKESCKKQICNPVGILPFSVN